jgi:hypothetical protein
MLLREIVKIHGKKIKTMMTGISGINTNIGNLSSLTTTEKSNLVGAVNENKSGIITINNKLQNGRALKNLLDASENYSAFTQTSNGIEALGTAPYTNSYYRAKYNDYAVYIDAMFSLKSLVAPGANANVVVNIDDVLADIFGTQLPVPVGFNNFYTRDFYNFLELPNSEGSLGFRKAFWMATYKACSMTNHDSITIGSYNAGSERYKYQGILLRTDTLDI